MTRKSPRGGKRSLEILIVDDHPVVREGLSALISAQPDLHVCGEAESCADALLLVETTSPDLIVVDISLKDGNGIELIKRIRLQHEKVQFLVSSMHDEGLYAERALRAGAMGYISKQESTQRIIVAIRRVLDGKVYLSDGMAERLLRGVVSGSIERSPVDRLADRELQVFELMGHGLNTRQIAARLELSSKTVETYRSRIRVKLNLGRGGALSRYAIQWILQSDQEQHAP